MIIWTTTPWTLPSNQAVCLNPDLEYALLKGDFGRGPEYMVIAEALVEDAMQRYQCESFDRVGSATGQSLENLLLQHPFTMTDKCQ